MDFVEIVMTVCALANSSVCEDRRIVLDSNMSVAQCVMAAPPTMARWANENPNWTIMRWSCDYASREKRKT
jgi:hypothetical protein